MIPGSLSLKAAVGPLSLPITASRLMQPEIEVLTSFGIWSRIPQQPWALPLLKAQCWPQSPLQTYTTLIVSEDAMSVSSTARRVVPAQLGFLAIYNPSLGTTDETVDDQIVYYTNAGLFPRDRSKSRYESDKKAEDERQREERNEQLRQIGLAQGMVEFGRSFSDGRAVDTVETEKARIILHELEAGWWILASINLTVLPGTTKTPATKSKPAEEQETTEYSSREVKPAILLLGDLLRAHSTFLLHHASSMSALFVRTQRSKFIGILGRYWDGFATSWNVLMHGNPTSSLYGGIKVAACGELGMGVGEEERGSGEREVLEGFVGRIEGLVDVIVSKFGDGESESTGNEKDILSAKPNQPWLGSGDEPATEDGAVFLGTGALSRKSLRDVSHWMEDLYQWGDNAYGVIDNPSSTRRSKKSKPSDAVKGRKDVLPGKKRNTREGGNLLASRVSFENQASPTEELIAPNPPASVLDRQSAGNLSSHVRRPSLKRSPGSSTSTESESAKTSRLIQYLRLGYGTHWSLGGAPSKSGESKGSESSNKAANNDLGAVAEDFDGSIRETARPRRESVGHYLVGLLGDFESYDDAIYTEGLIDQDAGNQNPRLLLRTVTVELEREEDARAEADISIDLGTEKDSRSTRSSSQHTGTSNASFDSQDRNKTKKLRVVVYVKKPFIIVFLFELRTDTLALSSFYRSLHQQVQPLFKPLLTSTTFRASKPQLASGDDKSAPIYDLIWDPRLLTINSTIPNIPEPYSQHANTDSLSWSRIEALNTHMQIVNTYIASSSDRSELERTCKTSRGWWVVWTRVPDTNIAAPKSSFGRVKVPGLIAEGSTESQSSDTFGRLRPQTPSTQSPNSRSRGTSTFKSSVTSGPAHPYLEAVWNPAIEIPRDKEIFLIRRASDHIASSRFTSGASAMVQEAGWGSGPAKLAQGIGVDTKRYIEALLNMNR